MRKLNKITILLGILFCMPSSVSWSQVKVEKARVTITTYMEKTQREETKWWLTKIPEEKDSLKIIPLFDAKNQQIRNTLNKFQSVSPLAKEIVQTFPKPIASAFVKGMSLILSMSKEPELPKEPGVLEICFISKDQIANSPGRISYRKDWRAVMMAAIDYPPTIFPGLVFYGMSHAYFDQKGAPGSTAPPESYEYMEQEVKANELEIEILDAAVKGKYYKYIDSVLKSMKPKTFREIIDNITPENLWELEKILNCPNCPKEIAGTMLGVYYFSFGARYISSLPLANPMDEKVALYRLVSQTLKEYPTKTL